MAAHLIVSLPGGGPLLVADAPQQGVFAKAAADYGTYIEINTKKTHLTDEQWRKVFETDVKFVVDSDAHSPDRIGDNKLFLETAKRVNFPFDRIMNIDGRIPDLRFQRYKKEHGIGK